MKTGGCEPLRSALIVGLLVCCAWSADAAAAQRAVALNDCDRECLRGKVTQLLHALVMRLEARLDADLNNDGRVG